jgi:hypothetical protein
MRAEADQQQAMQDAEIARYKADLDARTALEAAQLKAAVDREAAGNQMIIQREKMEMDHQYRMMELAAEKELEREKMRAGSRDGQGNIDVSD